MALVKITYYRNTDRDNIKTVIVKESQVSDIKRLSHINIVKIEFAPKQSKRSYVLY